MPIVFAVHAVAPHYITDSWCYSFSCTFDEARMETGAAVTSDKVLVGFIRHVLNHLSVADKDLWEKQVRLHAGGEITIGMLCGGTDLIVGILKASSREGSFAKLVICIIDLSYAPRLV